MEDLVIVGGAGTDTLHVLGDDATWDTANGKATTYINVGADGSHGVMGYGDGVWSSLAQQASFSGIEGSFVDIFSWG